MGERVIEVRNDLARRDQYGPFVAANTTPSDVPSLRAYITSQQRSPMAAIAEPSRARQQGRVPWVGSSPWSP